MSPLVYHAALGVGLVLAAAIAFPLIARRTRAVPSTRPVYLSVVIPALMITAAGGAGFIHLMLAMTLAGGIERYLVGGGELAFLWSAFALSWRHLGPGRRARPQSQASPGGPTVAPGV